MGAFVLLLAMGAAPPARMTAEQSAELGRLGAEARRAVQQWEAGKEADALAAMGRVLARAEEMHGRRSRLAWIVSKRLKLNQQPFNVLCKRNYETFVW